MNIALHNPHKLANLTNDRIHNYVLEMIKKGYIKYLFFDDPHILTKFREKLSHLNKIRKQYKWRELGLDKVSFIFSSATLNQKCDVLLNFNACSMTPDDYTSAIKKFPGLKIFHITDYFWRGPGSQKYKYLKEYGVDYLMSYGSPDKYCEYFKTYFPDYIGKVIPVPFGFAPRFVDTTNFDQRKNKCVAVGSVNPLRIASADPRNYMESANFFKGEEWFHKFRRLIVEHLDELLAEIDSMLPVFPKYKDNRYNLVEKFNEYKMFVSDESIFYFPAAKTFEGPACGTVMVCSDHPCFSDYGFIGGVNCITHKQLDIQDLKRQISYYQNHPAELARIQKNSITFVRQNYSHAMIADKVNSAIKKIRR